MSALSFSPGSFQTFGEMLRFLRRRERLTQLELSIAVGYSEAQIGRLEQDQRKPDLTAIQALIIPALHLDDDPELSARFLNLAQSARQEDAPFPGVSPYKGLLYFDRADSDVFFGREALTSHLARRILDLATRASPRFLTIVGASGSGKSSLLRAGLAPALQQEDWDVCIFTPNVHPLEMLAATYQPSPANDGKNHLVVVDQFEETFTHCRDETERSAFVERLVSLARNTSTRTTVVIALRADFYPHLAQYPILPQIVAAEQEYIGQMTRQELTRAIEEPANRRDWRLEPGLVDLLLSDIGAAGAGQPEAGALPILSHALLATWERRRGRTLTIQGYRAAGGVGGAIAQTAETVFSDQLNRTEQDLARDIFLRLTKLGEGTEDTGRRATLNELALYADQPTQVRTVLNILTTARLITMNEDSAEVAHEALIREWSRLREWLTQDRDGLRLHRHLTESAREWGSRGQDPAELYRGVRLAQASEWASANQKHLNTSERAFIRASVEQEQHVAREREAQHQRELESAKELAKAEQRRAAEQTRFALQMRQRALYLAGALMIAFILAGVALSFSNQSNQNALAALNERARAVASADNTARLLNYVMGKELVPLSGHAASDSVIAYSPNGNMVAARSEQDKIVVWDSLSGDPLITLAGHTGQVTGLAFSPDNTRIASGSADGTAMIWDLSAGKPLFTLRGDSHPVESVSFSPDEKHLLTCSTATAIIWDETTGSPLFRLAASYSFRDAAYSPDGSRIATADLDGTAKIWDAYTGKELLEFPEHSAVVRSITFSADGKWLLAVNPDGSAQAWNAMTGLLVFSSVR